MAKGYWVVNADVHDPEVYDRYRQANAAALNKYNARFLVRGGTQEIREGEARTRTVVLEFPSYADALACYDSELYQSAKAIRDPVSTADFLIVEGWDG